MVDLFSALSEMARCNRVFKLMKVGNNKMKKFISIIIIFMCISILISCNSENKNNENNGDSISNEDIANDISQEIDGNTKQTPESEHDNQDTQRILSAAPKKDFEGYEYRVLSRDETNPRWHAKDITAEEENGNPINDAVYKRNAAIEEKYNIKIVNKPSSDLLTSARNAIMADSDEYDIMMGTLRNFADVLSMGGMVEDLKNVPYLDLPKPWYDQKANEQLTIANKLYVTICDIGTTDRNATYGYLFNKKLISELGLENPYQLVRDGKWTIDKLLEMSKGVSRDLNGDGTMGIEDQYGYSGEIYNMYIGLLSARSGVTAKDDNDLPIYTGLDNAGITVFEKLLSMFGDKNISLRADDHSGDVWGNTGIMDSAFREDRVLFFNTGIVRVTIYRDMESDFGIIPSPKRDENQKEYISTLTAVNTNSLSIPVTVRNFERTGIITDALSAESHYTLIPAYYDVQLKTKFARDDESSEMLDIIFKGRRFDLALIYDWAGVSNTFATAMQNNSPNIVSALEKIQDRIVSEIAKTIEAYNATN